MRPLDWQIGDVRVTLIPETIATDLSPRTFFPEFDEAAFAAELPWLAPDHYDAATDRIRLSVHSWLVRTGKQTILIDACCGNAKPRPGFPDFDMLDTPWLDRLRAAGVSPEQIDIVMCTHLHADHVGWNTVSRDGRWVPTFPNAKYVMSRQDYHLWCAPGASAFRRMVHEDSVLPVMNAGQAVLIDDGYDGADRLVVVPAPGHTPGHFRLDLKAGACGAVFAADALHNPVQVPLWCWSASSCDDPVRSRQTRFELLAHCAETAALMLPAHFAEPHAAVVRRKGERFELDWRPAPG